MTRQRIPNRCYAEGVSFNHGGRRWTATFGSFRDGRLAEVFLDAPQETHIADAARESAVLASLALQHGCSLDTIKHALDGRDAGPLAAALWLVEGYK